MIDFQWHVCREGYRWFQGEAYKELPPTGETHHGRYLIPAALDRHRRYIFTKLNSGLFRTVCATPLTGEGIRQFAEEYGPLCYGPFTVKVPTSTPGAFTLYCGDNGGDSFEGWIATLRALRWAVALWDMIHTEDTQQLRQYIRWDNQHTVSFRDGRNYVCIASLTSPLVHPDLLQSFGEQAPLLTPGDVIEPAREYLRTLVNRHLEGQVDVRLLWRLSNKRTPSIPDRHVHFQWCPKDLRAALWLQLAMTIEGEKEYRQCAQCEAWFEVNPPGDRVDKHYCSTKCRSAAYRARQEKTHLLYSEGTSLADIAFQLHTDIPTVQRWLSTTVPANRRRPRGRPRSQPAEPA